MSLFLLIVSSFVAFDLLWWRWADRHLRQRKHRTLWRGLLGAFMGFELAGLFLVLGSRLLGVMFNLPLPLLVGIYLWHMLILPLSVLALGLGGVLKRAGRLLSPNAMEEWMRNDELPMANGLSRREMLRMAAIAVPPVLLWGSTGVAINRLGNLRLRRFTLNIPDLPPAMEGLTIAHITDVHTGRFTNGAKLAEIAEMANQLKPDLMVMTGDLIDFTLSDLPAALDMLRRLDPRHGLFAVEGNHDLFESRAEFERRVKAGGIELLLNESRLVKIRGQEVQMLGLKWGGGRSRREPLIHEHIKQVLALRKEGAFPILLAHHPHAFDPASEAGLPLVLAGHTHGGQLMVTPNLGPGPLLFKYWSGLYQRQNTSLLVSNGVGNWFPVRINAPAEILHLTLTNRQA